MITTTAIAITVGMMMYKTSSDEGIPFPFSPPGHPYLGEAKFPHPKDLSGFKVYEIII